MLRTMLPTREALGYRGLVKEVLERRKHRPDWVMTTRWSFARDGKPLSRDVENGDGSKVHYIFSYDADGEWVRPDVRTVRGADGSFTEYWSLGPAARNRATGLKPVLSSPVILVGHGAAVVEAAYRSDGSPTGVKFRRADGAVVSEIVYRLDNHGRVVEAKQFSDLETGPLKSADSASAPYSDRVQVAVEVVFEYGDRGELRRFQTTSVGLKEDPPMLYVYNEHGDVASQSSLGEEEVRFEYEYDDRGNWVRKVVLVRDNPVYDTLRSLSYYPDSA